MRHMWYKLNADRKPVPIGRAAVADIFGSDRRVGDDTVAGDVRVSTVFLGLDHQFDDDGPPLLFETMIFGGKHDGYQERYSTWEEAEAGHKIALAIAGGTDVVP